MLPDGGITLGTIFLAHGAMQFMWEIIFDRIPSARRITHKHTHAESTLMLIKQLEEMNYLPQEKSGSDL